MSRVRIERLGLQVFERDLVGAEGIARFFEPAGGDDGVAGGEVGLVELANRPGPQPHEALVFEVFALGQRREQFGVEDHPHLAADVVEHPVGVDDAVALAELDVAFHVDFERRVLLLRRLAAEAEIAPGGPNHRAIGGEVDRADGTKRGGDGTGRQPFDQDADAPRGNDRSLAGSEGLGLDLRGIVAAGEEFDPPHAGRTGRNQHRRRDELGVLGHQQLFLMGRVELHQAALINLRRGIEIRRRLRHLHADVAGSFQAFEPRRLFLPRTGLLHHLADLRIVDDDLISHGGLEVGDHFRGPPGGGLAAINPQHRFGGTTVDETLIEVAVAPQVPDFVVALLPLAAPVGRDGDRLGAGRQNANGLLSAGGQAIRWPDRAAVQHETECEDPPQRACERLRARRRIDEQRIGKRAAIREFFFPGKTISWDSLERIPHNVERTHPTTSGASGYEKLGPPREGGGL